MNTDLHKLKIVSPFQWLMFVKTSKAVATCNAIEFGKLGLICKLGAPLVATSANPVFVALVPMGLPQTARRNCHEADLMRMRWPLTPYTLAALSGSK